MLIYTTLNPLSAKKSKVQIQSESDFMLARASPSSFAVPYHFSQCRNVFL